MIMLLLKDGSTVEVRGAADVVQEPGRVVCYDASGRPLTSFTANEVWAYTLNAVIAERWKEESGDGGRGSSVTVPSPDKLHRRHRSHDLLDSGLRRPGNLA